MKVHPGAYDLITDLYDNHILDYEALSALLGVSESRVQQIVLQTRRRRNAERGIHADAASSGFPDHGGGTPAA